MLKTTQNRVVSDVGSDDGCDGCFEGKYPYANIPDRIADEVADC